MYTQADLNVVFNYNKTAKIFRVVDNKRVLWDLRNCDKTYLNSNLSAGLQVAEDLAMLKKQVRKALLAQGQIA